MDYNKKYIKYKKKYISLQKGGKIISSIYECKGDIINPFRPEIIEGATPSPEIKSVGIFKNVHIPGYFNIGEKKYYFKNIINSGAHGKVYKYQSDDMHIIAVKIGDIEDDIGVLKILKNGNVCKDLYIRSTVTPDNKYIVMDLVNGSLQDLYKEQNSIDILFIMHILKEVVVALKCLHDVGLYYTDVTLENILYTCIDNNYKIILADMGSATLYGKDYSIKYPLYSDAHKKFENDRLRRLDKSQDKQKIFTTEKAIVWGVGIFLLQLLREDFSKYDWVSMRTLSKEQFIYYLNIHKKRYPIFEDIITVILDINHPQINLEGLLAMLEKKIDDEQKPGRKEEREKLEAAAKKYHLEIPLLRHSYDDPIDRLL